MSREEVRRNEDKYQEALLHNGIGLRINNLDSDVLRIVSRSSQLAADIVRLGQFKDASGNDLLVVPNKPDELDALVAGLGEVARSESAGSLARVQARGLLRELYGKTGTSGDIPQHEEQRQLPRRLPSMDEQDWSDPKVTGEELRQARLDVGTPKKKTRRPTGTSGMPFSVSYGLGVDSTAVLVGLAQLYEGGKRPEFRPDFITLGDTGGERDETYAYLGPVNRWLDKIGFPRVTITAYGTGFKGGSYGSSRTLEQQCLVNQTMPSISQSKKVYAKCSKLWKQQAQNVWFKAHAADGNGRLFLRAQTQDSRGYARKTWALRPGLPVLCVKCGWTGTSSSKVPQKCPVCPPLKDPAKEKMRGVAGIVKAIGYDADETGRSRAGTFRTADDPDGKFYTYWYPLQDWGWTRARCIAEIETAGLGVTALDSSGNEIMLPTKSACTYCGMAKKYEIASLPKDKLLRAILIEEVAKRSKRRRFPGWLMRGPKESWNTPQQKWKIPIALAMIEKYRETGIPQNVLMALDGDLGNRGLGLTFAWADYALSEGLITQGDLNRVIETAKKIIAEAPTEKGDWDASIGPTLSRIAAFRDVPGFRSTDEVFVAGEDVDVDEDDEDDEE